MPKLLCKIVREKKHLLLLRERASKKVRSYDDAANVKKGKMRQIYIYIYHKVYRTNYVAMATVVPITIMKRLKQFTYTFDLRILNV